MKPSHAYLRECMRPVAKMTCVQDFARFSFLVCRPIALCSPFFVGRFCGLLTFGPLCSTCWAVPRAYVSRRVLRSFWPSECAVTASAVHFVDSFNSCFGMTVRIGEASNPGPVSFHVGTANVTKLFDKTSELVDLCIPKALWALTETSSTDFEQRLIKKFFRSVKLRYLCSPACGHRARTHDRSELPTYGGTAVVSNLPIRPIAAELPAHVLQTTRIHAAFCKIGH